MADRSSPVAGGDRWSACLGYGNSGQRQPTNGNKSSVSGIFIGILNIYIYFNWDYNLQ